MDDGQVVAWVREGMLDAHVRDDAGGGWLPIGHSPFAWVVEEVVRDRRAKLAARAQRNAIVGGCVLALGFVGLLVYAAIARRERDAWESVPMETAEPVAAPEPTSEPELPTEVDAWVMCKQFVTKSLKSPGTADFGGVFSGDFQSADDHVIDLGDGKFRCTGWVDAQNALGATMRNNWTVVVRTDDGDEWAVIEGPNFAAR